MKNDPTQIVTIVVCGILILVAPIVGVSRVIVTQQALNQECNTHYSFIQVALAGNNLSRICQLKNQIITIK